MSLLRSFSPQVAPVAPVAKSEQPQYVPVVKGSKPSKSPNLVDWISADPRLAEAAPRKKEGRYDRFYERLSKHPQSHRYQKILATKNPRKIERKIKKMVDNSAERLKDLMAMRRVEERAKEAQRVKSLEQREARRLAAELRRKNAKDYVERMSQIRQGTQDDLSKIAQANNYYPNQKKMIRFLETDKVLSLVRNTPRKESLYSKRDLLEAGLLKELHAWILWPMNVYRLLPDNVRFKRVVKLDLQFKVVKTAFQGYDLRVVSLILRHLIGGIKEKLRSWQSQTFVEKLFYFPFYTSSPKEGSSIIKEIEPDSEMNSKFETQREGMNKNTQTSYMQWTLSPYDYGGTMSNKSGTFSRALWKELGATELLKAFKNIKQAGESEGRYNSVLFPIPRIGLKEYGIQTELNKAQESSSDVGVKYKWPGFEELDIVLDSPLLFRLNYLIREWGVQKNLHNQVVKLKKKRDN